jgi:hypothetical protein
MLHCDEKVTGCRVCDHCRFGVQEKSPGLVQNGKCPHDCCLSAHEREKCMEKGHTVLVLPDLGVGKKVFEDSHQQEWGGVQGYWSIREQAHVERLRDLWSQTDDMQGDPREVVKKVYVLMENEKVGQRQQRASARKAGNPHHATSSTCLFVNMGG